MSRWKIIQDKSQDYWLEAEDPEGWYKASVKWDGCIHFNRYHNIPYSSDNVREDPIALTDYLHICDLDEHIERLVELRELAKKYYEEHGRDWPC